ncbi:unnamed protein product [Protopolystoma xenopodis]|uniref:Uncharacterized protein n=1 Tax=Protopolystoma xenopodis TaxID=117903 RepID=A0A448XD53_9PLAT|nr:unnamed protein product [Protopolystoma xenopodis]
MLNTSHLKTYLFSLAVAEDQLVLSSTRPSPTPARTCASTGTRLLVSRQTGGVLKKVDLCAPFGADRASALKLRWRERTSLKVKAFLDEFALKLTRATDIREHRIDSVILQIAKSRLIELPPAPQEQTTGRPLTGLGLRVGEAGKGEFWFGLRPALIGQPCRLSSTMRRHIDFAPLSSEAFGHRLRHRHGQTAHRFRPTLSSGLSEFEICPLSIRT